jgi:hypothetical protein
LLPFPDAEAVDGVNAISFEIVEIAEFSWLVNEDSAEEIARRMRQPEEIRAGDFVLRLLIKVRRQQV